MAHVTVCTYGSSLEMMVLDTLSTASRAGTMVQA